jgi:adenine-specific DNA-methyltransferase
MPKSLLEQLPEIVATGRKTAERILESIESRQRVTLQTREVVLPAKDAVAQDWIAQQARATQREVFAPGQASLLDNPQPMLGAVIGTAAEATPWTNRLIYGDNLLAMAALLAGEEQTPSLRGKVDLIYIDPPFDSKADYRTKVTLPGVELEQRPTVIEQFAYSDTWSDGTASYLAMITPRLILMRELLADTGSIYVHLDWHVGHYVKLVMDEVFGKENFTNEIIWKRSEAHSDSSAFGAVHDVIFFYKKTKNTIWNRQYVPYTSDYIERQFKYTDEESGRRFRSADLSASGLSGGGYTYEWNGITRSWRCPIKTMERYRDEGRLDYTGKGLVRYKYFLDEMPGLAIQSVWTDIGKIHHLADERINYQTRLVADFNGGSGTTAAVAEKLRPSLDHHRSRQTRLHDHAQAPDRPGRQAVSLPGHRRLPGRSRQGTLGRDFRIGDLSQIVLSLYGALPLPAEANPQRNLGQIAGVELQRKGGAARRWCWPIRPTSSPAWPRSKKPSRSATTCWAAGTAWWCWAGTSSPRLAKPSPR